MQGKTTWDNSNNIWKLERRMSDNIYSRLEKAKSLISSRVKPRSYLFLPQNLQRIQGLVIASTFESESKKGRSVKNLFIKQLSTQTPTFTSYSCINSPFLSNRMQKSYSQEIINQRVIFIYHAQTDIRLGFHTKNRDKFLCQRQISVMRRLQNNQK